MLVNNAGYLLPVTLADPAAGADALTEVLGVNLVGAYLVTAALDDLLTRPGGRVINVSSIAAFTGGSGAAPPRATPPPRRG